MAQFGEKVWFRQTGEDGVCSFSSRMTQGIFCHDDRTGAVLCITKSGVVRGQSWTRQTLSDPWDATNWSGLCGTPWQMVATTLKLTKKVKGVGPPLPRTSRLTVTLENCPGCAPPAWKSDPIAQQRTSRKIRTISRENLDGKGKDECIQRVAESERVEERNRARVERGAEDVPMELGNEQQMADRHAVTSGVEENDTKRTE